MSDAPRTEIGALLRDMKSILPTTAETPTMRERLENAAAASLTTFILKKQTPQAAVVDAILREMLEPSEGMLEDGYFIINESTDPFLEPDDVKEGWQVMIRHILNETKD